MRSAAPQNECGHVMRGATHEQHMGITTCSRAHYDVGRDGGERSGVRSSQIGTHVQCDCRHLGRPRARTPSLTLGAQHAVSRERGCAGAARGRRFFRTGVPMVGQKIRRGLPAHHRTGACPWTSANAGPWCDSRQGRPQGVGPRHARSGLLRVSPVPLRALAASPGVHRMRGKRWRLQRTG